MKPILSRRDFLKLLGSAAAPLIVGRAERLIPSSTAAGTTADAPGVIILVLDALSALNTSFNGYVRRTTPNMERFARRSTVYHAHYSTANFTSPSTASLLTGLYPWTHRAFHVEGMVDAGRVDSNLFRYWGNHTSRLGYTQNAWADILLYQFSQWLDVHLDLQEFNLNRDLFYETLFRNDPVASYRSSTFSLDLDPNFSASSISALIRKVAFYISLRSVNKRIISRYPMGVPMTVNDVAAYFLLEDLFDGLMKLTGSLPPSSLAYLHLYPPHVPYAPRAEFVDAFDDGWKPPVKPTAPLIPVGMGEPETRVLLERGHYDAYIATVDDDFGRLLDFMEREGILDNNYVMLTSDHGDIYERGVIGHMNEYLYEPLVRIPLVISSPGQTSQVDVHMPTSSIDVLPTLLSLTGRSVPDACEGILLPGLGGKDDAQRSIFSIDTKATHVKGQIRNATVSLRKGQYKLIAYLGYEGFEDRFELYDLQNDPEEMHDLPAVKPETFLDMRHELQEKMSEINKPYLRR